MQVTAKTAFRQGCSANGLQSIRISPRIPASRQSTPSVNRQSIAAKVAFADASSLVSAEPAELQKKYILGELLGSGTAAHVHVGTDSQTGLQYAVKILPKRKGSRDRTELIRFEVSSQLPAPLSVMLHTPVRVGALHRR